MAGLVIGRPGTGYCARFGRQHACGGLPEKPVTIRDRHYRTAQAGSWPRWHRAWPSFVVPWLGFAPPGRLSASARLPRMTAIEAVRAVWAAAFLLRARRRFAVRAGARASPWKSSIRVV